MIKPEQKQSSLNKSDRFAYSPQEILPQQSNNISTGNEGLKKIFPVEVYTFGIPSVTTLQFYPPLNSTTHKPKSYLSIYSSNSMYVWLPKIVLHFESNNILPFLGALGNSDRFSFNSVERDSFTSGVKINFERFGQ